MDKYKEDLKVQKINFEQIFDILMNYTYNFTKSSFIIYDTRKLILAKKQLFLKKFFPINDNIKQLELMRKENQILLIFKSKNIILILKDGTSLYL